MNQAFNSLKRKIYKSIILEVRDAALREIPVKCRIRRNVEFLTLTITHKNFHYTATTSIYIIRIKLVIDRRYTK